MLSPHPRGPAFLLDQVLPYGRTPQGIPVIDVRQSHNRVRALRFRLLAEYVGKPFAIRSLLSIPASDSDSARRVFLPFLHRWIRCANEFFFPSAFPKAIRQILNFHKVDDEVDRIRKSGRVPLPTRRSNALCMATTLGSTVLALRMLVICRRDLSNAMPGILNDH